METKRNNSETSHKTVLRTLKSSWKVIASILVTLMLTVLMGSPVYAHCDSYDGPVVKDAMKALETNNVSLVLKWVDVKQEQEITSLFNKTYNFRNGDREIYILVEKHFLETLVRLHRETEGAPFTGLKPAGTTKAIVQLSDNAIGSNSVDDLISQLKHHIEKVVREKYQKVVELNKVKDSSVEKGREYVKAYIDYTHTLEAIHDIIELSNTGQSVHKH